MNGNLETRLLYGLVGRSRRKQAVAVGEENDLVALGVPQARFVVETLDLGGDQYPQIEVLDLAGKEEVRVVLEEALDRAHARFALLHGLPEIADGVADRGYDAEAGHHDTSAATGVCHLDLA